jgi:hypothetical protein
VSTRRDDAIAALTRLGLDPDAVATGTLPAERVVAALRGPEAATAAAALGELGSDAVAATLVAIEAEIGDRAVRKAVRRALYRLGQRGVAVPARPAAPPVTPRLAEPSIEGLISAFDGAGDRLVWLMKPLPGAGTFLIAAELNEPRGLGHVEGGEIGRKQLRTARARLEKESGLRLVAADWRVLDALLVEGHERAASSEHDYLRMRRRLTTDAPAAAAEPVSRHVTSPAPHEVGALLAAAPALLEEPELRSWWPAPDAAEPFLAEMAQIEDSPIVLPRLQQEERMRMILERAAGVLFPPGPLARRLDGTAYVFAETNRTAAARQALASAAALRERPTAAHEVPLVAALVQRAIGLLLSERQSRRQDERRGSLVMTPDEARARASARPPHTRG